MGSLQRNSAWLPTLMLSLLMSSSPDAFAADIKSGIPQWAKVIKESGVKPD